MMKEWPSPGIPIFLFISSFLLSYIGTQLFQKAAYRFQIMDIPNVRSSHSEPTPRGGGIAIYFSFYLTLFFALLLFQGGNFDSKWVWGLTLGGVIVSLGGFLDDIRGLPPLFRLLAQVIAGSILILFGLSLKTLEIPFWREIDLGLLGIPLTLIWIVWIVNLYNFMDGIDGLAAGVGMIAAFFFSLVARRTGNDLVSFSGMILAGCSAGFLIHNFPPARIFLGDIGSSLIGFLFAGFALIGNHDLKGPFPIWVAVLLLGAFIFDTSVTLLRRILKGEKWFSAHRSHFYQRLINLHLSHRQVSFMEYGLSILLGLSSLIYLRADPLMRGLFLLGWALVFTAGALMIRFHEGNGVREKESK
jgi:UDP-GlcNAc:undecaprenyl-phosphate GlcNAc-1-phosphate transferase